MNPYRYRPFPAVGLTGRKWPGNVITAAPEWCSVDLRDGNQALETPMNQAEKLEFFEFLCGVGFKTIEVGFPAASKTEFDFTRRLIDDGLIPGDVTIQVLTQCREEIIRKTFEAVKGAGRVVMHFYNSTSAVQRRVVFKMGREEIKRIAVDAAGLVKRLAEEQGAERFWFEYSPESFTATEPDFAAEVCAAVAGVIQPTAGRRLIFNLPATVESATPNVYADQIEYMLRALPNPGTYVISVHAHNDRGTAVAATELAMLAGAGRVEGTLFGNGERTGNADLLTLALNLYTQGIDPGLDFSRIDETAAAYERLIKLPVHPRHPYAGEMVYTAYSGSHQDAISKAMALRLDKDEAWDVPYLPIDPADVGRSYEPIIRINSQSGKGGVAYVLKTRFGLDVPADMRKEFGQIATAASDAAGKPLEPQEIYELFAAAYINVAAPLNLAGHTERTENGSDIQAVLLRDGASTEVRGHGDGIVEAFASALRALLGVEFEIADYSQHALEAGTKAKAISYVSIVSGGRRFYGAGVSANISRSSLRAVVSAVNRLAGSAL